MKLKAPSMLIEAATSADVDGIVSVFIANKSDRGLFQESEAQVRQHLADFLVARDANGKVVACAGLCQDSDELAEVYGVAVLPEVQGQGMGGMLIQECKRRAIANRIAHLWLATVKPAYFSGFSFRPMSRWHLPMPVLVRKVRLVFQQPVPRWAPALFGRHTFMICDLRR